MSKSDSPPTKEISSLTQVFEDETLALLFRDFLHANSCAENLAFWLAVEEFKTITEDRQRRKAAEKIYKKFFTECDIPINVDASVKDEVSIQLESPDEISTKIYDSCQEAIYSMLEFDSFRKFLTSDAYKTYLANGKKSSPKENGSPVEGATAKEPKKGGLFALFGKYASKEKKRLKSVDSTSAPRPDLSKSESLLQLRTHVSKNQKKQKT